MLGEQDSFKLFHRCCAFGLVMFLHDILLSPTSFSDHEIRQLNFIQLLEIFSFVDSHFNRLERFQIILQIFYICLYLYFCFFCFCFFQFGFNYSYFITISNALRDLIPFVQFKKREKHPWRSVTFSKVAGQQRTTYVLLFLCYISYMYDEPL